MRRLRARASNQNQLAHYLNGITDVLASRSKLVSPFSHRGDNGTHREIVCQEFLNKHIPRRLSAHLGGQVFAVGAGPSKQIDIIVAHDVSISFFEHHKPQFPVEATASAVSVKSKLTSSELKKALSELASIPQLNERTISFPLLEPTTQFSIYSATYPSLYVFAFDGMKYDSCRKSILQYYSENQDIPLNRRATAIVVNGQYLIHIDRSSHTSEIVLNGGYIEKNSVSRRGWPLLWLTADIAKIVPWLSHMQLDFQGYLDQAYSNPAGD